jgi:transmembrane sensor
MLTNNRLAILIIKYLHEVLSDEESVELKDLCARSEEKQAIFSRLTNPDYLLQELRSMYQFNAERCWHKVLQRYAAYEKEVRVNERKPASINIWRWVTAAAILIAIIGTIAYWWFNNKGTQQINSTAIVTAEDSVNVIPTGNHAILALHDGSIVKLDGAHKGLIRQEGNATIVENEANELVYTMAKEKRSPLHQPARNQIATSPGKKLSLMLADGSKLLIDSATAISYYTDTSGSIRDIQLITGRISCEVTKNKSKPFLVKIAGITITAIGTRFNISAYPGEKHVIAMLQEGSIQITNRSVTETLQKAGQSAIITNDGPITVNQSEVTSVNDPSVLREFRHDDFVSTMKKLKSWYGITPVYQGRIPKGFFTAGVHSQDPVDITISMMAEAFHVKLKLVNKQLIVAP